jgi:hypothetical protein
MGHAQFAQAALIALDAQNLITSSARDHAFHVQVAASNA